MNYMFKANTVMFDLDGTLIDSVPDIAWAADRMCEDLGLPPRGAEKVRNWIGNGPRMLVRRAIADSLEPCDESDQVEDALQRFERYHAEHCCVDSVLYPTVYNTLKELHHRKHKLCLITNKQSLLARTALEYFGLLPFFELVFGFEDLPEAKPSPLPLLTAMDKLGRPGIFVGDSGTDISAARAACVPVIAMTYGYNHGVPVATLNPDAICSLLEELLQLVARD